ncbi:MAG: M23 family metallopeptidase [Chloroflexi bacterium]|nr:M23 family metallopeptidase [Chloroflexota bacterium]
MHPSPDFRLPLLAIAISPAHIVPGGTVPCGQLIGHVGNSSISQGPHLHDYLQNGPTLFVDQGLPVQFSHFLMTGDRVEQNAIPAGAIVNPLPASGAA